jgi:hypothetical protein
MQFMTAEAGVFVAAMLAVCAALTLAWAWRGRQLEIHPRCRRCGFGLPVTGGPAHGVGECPDCGADLSGRRAIHVGRRRRHRRVIAVSLLVMALSTAYVAVSTSTQAQGFEWLARKPLAWVIADAGAVDGRTHDAALAELVRRLRAGELLPAKEKALVELALARQADLNQPWAPGWGDLVEASRAMGRVSDEQWGRYQVQSVTFLLGVNQPRVRDVKDLRLELARAPDRVASRPSFRADLGLYAEPAVIVAGQAVRSEVDPAPDRPGNVGDAEVPELAGAELVTVVDVPRPPTSDVLRLARVSVGSTPATLRDGPQTVRVPVIVRPLTLTWKGPERRPTFQLAPAERRVEVEAKFQLLPGETLDGLVGPEFKGVWVPPIHREKLMREAARRREARTTQPANH